MLNCCSFKCFCFLILFVISIEIYFSQLDYEIYAYFVVTKIIFKCQNLKNKIMTCYLKKGTLRSLAKNAIQFYKFSIYHFEVCFKTINAWLIVIGPNATELLARAFLITHPVYMYSFVFLDTAYVYGNEEDIGIALKELLPKYNLKREDVFITTKLR